MPDYIGKHRAKDPLEAAARRIQGDTRDSIATHSGYTYSPRHSVPKCCGQEMYRCNAEHVDGKSYLHCHSCWRNVEVAA